jgi:exopolysaccharide biosynthesis polyprenyl glycosylphosphotransferase
VNAFEQAEAVARPALRLAEVERRPARAVGRTAKDRGWLVRRSLLASDVVTLLLAFATAELLVGGAGAGARLLVFVLTLPAWIAAAKVHGLYEGDDERPEHSTLDDLSGVVHLVTLATWLLALTWWAIGVARPGLDELAVFWALALALVILGRATARTTCRRSAAYVQRAVVVGAGEGGRLIARTLLRHPGYGIELLGFVDSDVTEDGVLGRPEDLPELVKQLRLDRVIVASSGPEEELSALVRRLGELGVHVDLVPRLVELVGPRAHLHRVESVALVGIPPPCLSPSSALLKRSFDVVGAAVGLVLAAPLFALIAWRIKRDSAGPVFFRQTRVGLNMKKFTVLKFRTMRADADDAEHRRYIEQTMSGEVVAHANGLYKLDRRKDVTRFGAWLRKTSLDELPQLVNVLRGDMSLVGPRPCILYETDHFEPHHFERFLVPAGLTGLWQVSARAQASFAEALDLDVAYVRGWSLGLDLKLLVRTPAQVFRKKVTA